MRAPRRRRAPARPGSAGSEISAGTDGRFVGGGRFGQEICTKGRPPENARITGGLVLRGIEKQREEREIVEQASRYLCLLVIPLSEAPVCFLPVF